MDLSSQSVKEVTEISYLHDFYFLLDLFINKRKLQFHIRVTNNQCRRKQDSM